MKSDSMNQHIPHYLYHYTSVEALACILQSQSIRFTTLTNMDDLMEGQTADGSTLASFMCVSSWTDQAIDSIPFWREYAGLKNGVMIRMRTNPFMKFNLSLEEKADAIQAKLGINIDADFLLPYSVLRELNYSLMAINNELLHKVIYTDDDDQTRPKISEFDGEGTTIRFGNLGLCKRTAWKYQQEWRYRVLVIPFGLHEIRTDGDVETARYNYHSSVTFLDLPIRRDAFESMRVVTSPQLSIGNRIMVDLLKDRFNPTMEIEHSKLTGMIR